MILPVIGNVLSKVVVIDLRVLVRILASGMKNTTRKFLLETVLEKSLNKPG